MALPNKGRLQEPAIGLLKKVGIRIVRTERQYLAETSESNLKIIFVRASDIPAYVYFGAADLGITGHDLVAERMVEVYELLDLKFGRCELTMAVPTGSRIYRVQDLPNDFRIATEFPNLTSAYFEKLGKKIEIIAVRGSTEITPSVGLADAIVDLTSTGKTLEANDLRPIGTLLVSSARLICNKIALRTKEKSISPLVSRIRSIVGDG
jgi:ATP phosphoribosyltransferase